MFYIDGVGWIPASMIEEGDVVVLQSGDKSKVEKIDKVVHNELITVYNFEVEDFHTYFVSDASVLVHNDYSGVRRKSVAGRKHPTTGVDFDSDGFPVFKSKYDMQLDPTDYSKSRGTHFRRASKALYADIMKNSSLKSKFTAGEIGILKKGGVPKSYTWHHHQSSGKMQLVNRVTHRKTGHKGGFSIWGPGK
ncbi:hypothetical protein TPELB_33390 [Terrisporobacter petrolearius]|uniref:Intein C-terminal splicing region n=1 Tax=Terrisporobacter petrolearius TaxID=1460447 RepID=A0ABZ3FHX4_9FIRM